MVCNTLNLEYGSQQDMHQDTLYMPSRVINKMVASWIALEPATSGIEPIAFHAEKGDLLIWHSQLLHGGSAIAEQGSTRKSLVTHYFRRKDYLHRFWKIRKHQSGAYYYVKQPMVA